MAHEAGKGDHRRPGNDDAFRNNYDLIFGKKKQEKALEEVNKLTKELYEMEPVVKKQQK